jgi:hypothetical protein
VSKRSFNMTAEKPNNWWQQTLAFLRKYILAPLPILCILAGAVILIALGAKNVQVGGLIGKILGKKGSDGKKAIDVANTIPEDRVDQDGNLIPIGEPDSKGITQAKVVAIKKPGLFDDPTKVKIVDPDTKKDVVVHIPDGVKAKDVDKVVIVSPEVTAVTVKSESKVTATEVDDLLNKYKL